MELKLLQFVSMFNLANCFNRTFMELKQMTWLMSLLALLRFNRTFMELKQDLLVVHIVRNMF